jgi:hypothetical protein
MSPRSGCFAVKIIFGANAVRIRAENKNSGFSKNFSHNHCSNGEKYGNFGK